MAAAAECRPAACSINACCCAKDADAGEDCDADMAAASLARDREGTLGTGAVRRRCDRGLRKRVGQMGRMGVDGGSHTKRGRYST